MEITTDYVQGLIFKALKAAWENKKFFTSNSKRSSLFVSELADVFSKNFDKRKLVQHVNSDGSKSQGEWLLDIVIATISDARTSYKNRHSTFVNQIHWAIESEFSTNLTEFCRDFSKLLHIKSEHYLYIAGINQVDENSKIEYIKSQSELAKMLVKEQKINEPFFLAFVPTPGKTSNANFGWDLLKLDDLMSNIKVIALN